MKFDMTDDKLKQFFNKMRLEDEAGSPSFEQLVPKTVTAARPFATAWRFAAAMTLIVMLGAGTVMFFAPQQNISMEPAYENWSALSNWKATTDNMLALSVSKIDGTLTTSTDTLLDGVSATLNE